MQDHNTAFVNLGTNTEGAGTSVLRWWNVVGRVFFPDAHRLYVICDLTWNNFPDSRLWEMSLQILANETGMDITVSFYLYGLSRWNKVEHRLAGYSTRGAGSKMQIDIETMVECITPPVAKSETTVFCQRDERSYPSDKELSEREMPTLNINPCDPLQAWNYVIRPYN